MTMNAAVDMSKIGLRPREMQVLRAVHWAAQNVEGGRYLCGTGQRRAAERMIVRGFLTKAEAEIYPPTADWLVVQMTMANWQALEAAAENHS